MRSLMKFQAVSSSFVLASLTLTFTTLTALPVKARAESQKAYLQCFLLNAKTEPTAFVLTPLNLDVPGDTVLPLDFPALSTPRYEVGVVLNKKLEITEARMTDKIKQMSVVIHNLKVAPGDSMQASFVQGEKELDPQAADCSIKYYPANNQYGSSPH